MKPLYKVIGYGVFSSFFFILLPITPLKQKQKKVKLHFVTFGLMDTTDGKTHKVGNF